MGEEQQLFVIEHRGPVPGLETWEASTIIASQGAADPVTVTLIMTTAGLARGIQRCDNVIGVHPAKIGERYHDDDPEGVVMVTSPTTYEPVS
jgi:hypothetical protein